MPTAIRIVLAALVAFVLSATYYGALVGGIWRELSPAADAFAAWQPIAQIARNLVVAFALNYALLRIAAPGLWSALQTALVLWLGFQAMAIAGSVIHEGYPLILYGIHAFDALMTTIVMTFCLKANLKPRAAAPAINPEFRS